MEVQEIEVTIGKDGKVEIEVHGVKGTSCLDMTKALEEALGGEIESREMKPDAYATVQEQVPDHQHVKGG